MKYNIVHLRKTGTYKDGGSQSFIDSHGNQYWINYKFRDRLNKSPEYGKLFKGSINLKKRRLAKGEFHIHKKHPEDGIQIINQ